MQNPYPLLWNTHLAQLRCLAALLVLLFHVYHAFFGLWQPNPDAVVFGWLIEGHSGVGLFFTLSGFLFMQQALHAGTAPQYGQFFRKRVLRIFPLFLVFFFVALSLNRDTFRPADVLYLVFSNVGDPPTSKHFITGAAWTISVEFTFYLAFPFLARFALAQGPGYLVRLIGLLLVLKLGAWLASERPTHMMYSTLLGRGDQFLIGMLLAQVGGAWAATKRSVLWPVFAGALMFVMLALLAKHASYFQPQPRQLAWLLWPTLEALGWGAVLLTYSAAKPNLPALLAKPLARGGEISYSVYLWHALIVYVLLQWVGDPNWFADWRLEFAALTAIVLAATWVVASLSYETIEKPFLNMRNETMPLTKVEDK